MRTNARISSRSGFNLVGLLWVIGMISLLACVFTPALGRMRRAANNFLCLNNLRQLSLAATVYAGDNADRLPVAERLPSQPADPQNPNARLADLLARYAGETAGTNRPIAASLFLCPDDQVGYFKRESSSYEWNATLNDQPLKPLKLRGFELPMERTPMLYDYENFHTGGANGVKNVAFLDGSAAPLQD